MEPCSLHLGTKESHDHSQGPFLGGASGLKKFHGGCKMRTAEIQGERILSIFEFCGLDCARTDLRERDEMEMGIREPLEAFQRWVMSWVGDILGWVLLIFWFLFIFRCGFEY